MANDNITNTLNTRIALKYDTLEKWNDSTLILKQGEIAIAKIENKRTINNDSAQTSLGTPPTIAMKVGDGEKTFSQLPWVQAVAGDVYAWAKKSQAPTIAELTDGVTDITELVNNVIGNTEGIQDTDTTYKVEQVKNDAGKHIVKLRAYSKAGVALSDEHTLTIDLSDIDTLTEPLKHIEYGKDKTAVDVNNPLMAKKAVQDTVEGAIGAIPVQPAADDDSAADFISEIANEDGKLTYKRIKITKEHINGKLDQDQVTGLNEIKANAENAITLLGYTDYGKDDAIDADNMLMTSSAVQEVVDTAIETLDAKISVEQTTTGNYVTSVERDDETGAIIVTRDTLNHDKIRDWDTEVTEKLNSKANKSDFFYFGGAYSDGVKPTKDNYIVLKSDLTDINDKVDALESAVRFAGTVDSNPTEWPDPNPDDKYGKGDMVILNAPDETTFNQEFVFDGEKWIELGAEGIHASKAELSTLTERVATLEETHAADKTELEGKIEAAIGTAGDNAAIAIEAALAPLDYSKPTNKGKFATSITQVNGKITEVQYTNLDEADIPNGMSTNKIKDLQSHIDTTKAHFNAAVGATGAANGLNESNPLATKDYVDTVAESAADAAAKAEVASLKTELNVTKASTAAKFATSVTQTDGKIAVDYANIYAADITDTVPLSKVANGTDIETVLNNIDGSVAALETNNKLATQATVDAAVDAGIAQLHAIAKTGNVNDLVQTPNEVLFLNCGSSTTVI